MESISARAFAKVNLSLDVIGRRTDGYHLIRSVMQAIELFDLVTVTVFEMEAVGVPGIELSVDCAQPLTSDIPPDEIPVDPSNTAYKAAAEMLSHFSIRNVRIKIHIQKNIPAAAGLAGGSADAAVVILALNHLLHLKEDLAVLNEIGLRVGADVPFCICAAAKNNRNLGLHDDPLASSAALCEGIGEILTPLPAAAGTAVLIKPACPVSTAHIYTLFDERGVQENRPDTNAIVRYLLEQADRNPADGADAAPADLNALTLNMINLLEDVTAFVYPVVADILRAVRTNTSADRVMMSGSGPTVFAYFAVRPPAEKEREKLRDAMPENGGTRIFTAKLLQ